MSHHVHALLEFGGSIYFSGILDVQKFWIKNRGKGSVKGKDDNAGKDVQLRSQRIFQRGFWISGVALNSVLFP